MKVAIKKIESFLLGILWMFFLLTEKGKKELIFSTNVMCKVILPLKLK